MSKYLDEAVRLRAITQTHYNCAQSVVIPFAKDAGVSEDVLYRISANFAKGMKSGKTCGAITGGLMVLGMFGIEDQSVIAGFFKRVKSEHNGLTDCADLLRLNKEKGVEQKKHCDSMVFECVGLVEEILREQGKLQK